MSVLGFVFILAILFFFSFSFFSFSFSFPFFSGEVVGWEVKRAGALSKKKEFFKDGRKTWTFFGVLVPTSVWLVVVRVRVSLGINSTGSPPTTNKIIRINKTIATPSPPSSPLTTTTTTTTTTNSSINSANSLGQSLDIFGRPPDTTYDKILFSLKKGIFLWYVSHKIIPKE